MGLQRQFGQWAEKIKEVVNCQVNADVLSPDILPILPYPPAASSTLLSAKEMSATLSEEVIRMDILKLRPGKAPGLDGISFKMLRLGEDENVHWFKNIPDIIWVTQSVPEDWLSQLFVPLHKKQRHTICDTYCGIALFSIDSSPAGGKGVAVPTSHFPCGC